MYVSLRSLLIPFLVFFAPSLGISCLAEPVDSDRKVVLHLQWLPQAQFAGYLVAAEKGFYREAGLSNVVIDSRAAAGPFQALLASECDFCCAWLPLAIRERSRGGELVELVQLFQDSSLAFIAHKESGIKSLSDLQGRRCQIWKSDVGDLPRLILKQSRVEPEIVPLTVSQSLFLRKIVPAQVVTLHNEYNGILEAGVRPEELVVITAKDCGFDYPEDGLFCRTETRKQEPELCAAFAEASLRGWVYALEPRNEAEVLDIIVARAHTARNITNRNHQRWMLRKVREHVTHRVGDDPAAWGKLSPEAYRKTVDMLRNAGEITEAVPYENFYRGNF